MKLSVIGIDVGKNVLHVHGADAQGKSVLRKTFGRGALVEWLAQQAPCLIGMEACGGAHHLARVLIDCGHTVRLIHPSFVKAYVKSNKNDFRDAEAIAEAVTRPTMRFVAIKTVAQQELQALHRLRSGAVTQRTAVINQLRGLLLEFGITVPRGPTALRRHLPEILEKVDGGVAALGRDLVAELQQEWVHLDERIAALEQRLRQQTRTSEPCRRLQTIPGAFWHPASDAWLVPTNQTTALAQTFTGWPLRWPSGTPTATATPEPSWAELLFAAVGSERADAVFKALARVLHPDARPTTEKGRVA